MHEIRRQHDAIVIFYIACNAINVTLTYARLQSSSSSSSSSSIGSSRVENTIFG